jgi:hypothetical protein
MTQRDISLSFFIDLVRSGYLRHALNSNGKGNPCPNQIIMVKDDGIQINSSTYFIWLLYSRTLKYYAICS